MEHYGQCLTSSQHKFLLESLETDLRSEYQRRIEIMLLADQGKSQAQICDELGCSQETARHWITMARMGQAHQWNKQPMGRPKVINEEYLHCLRKLASQSPRTFGYPFQHWTGHWLSKHLEKESGIKISACHVNRLLKSQGISKR
ncbi:helix-turn-helix domain-containing protein [Acaryochloris sp. IP29b_bin.148]|uniref:helix-turn-helix domain-containing protein n=1 Tax=Acaryochloris sp. IP29b_bin.148 TaxID=2969218 RepID=UPI00262D3B36|nr:helix-turn-helix domain-containing protein [Acaryochloris sp. IP29b_bin.148]